MRPRMLLMASLAVCLHGCSHGGGGVRSGAAYDEGIRTKGDSLSTRIWVLIARGEFAEAGEIPATLQRARDFPSQLKDFTCFQIKNMLDAGDYSLASLSSRPV